MTWPRRRPGLDRALGRDEGLGPRPVPRWARWGAALVASCALAAHARPTDWPDTALARTQALALLQTLNAALLSNASATLTLERWCADHALADPARLVAHRDATATKDLPADGRALLAIGADEPVRYRRVRLACGDRVLSEADNWYVPSRLTDAMNRALDTPDTPFGKAVRDLRFRRQTLSSELLWTPLAAGWEMRATATSAAGGSLPMPDHLLRHRAVLFAADQRPFSLVVETYTSDVLGFVPPR